MIAAVIEIGTRQVNWATPRRAPPGSGSREDPLTTGSLPAPLHERGPEWYA
jgi:hypothetical protein